MTQTDLFLMTLTRRRDFLTRLCSEPEAVQLSHTLVAAVDAVVPLLCDHRPLLVCGNGGSAADSGHIAGELVGRFLHERKPLPVIPLVSDPAVVTCLANDYGYGDVFARQVAAYGGGGGAVLGISTSGRSANVVAALKKGHDMGLVTIALTGAYTQDVASYARYVLAVPSTHTPDIQEIHMMLYHTFCAAIEQQVMAR